MSTAFWAIVYQERRRLVFVTGLAFVAGVLFYWHSSVYLSAVHISLITGGVYAGVVGLAAMTICALLPSMRYMMESVALSRLMLAILFLGNPKLGEQFLSNPLLLAVIVVVGGACISRLIHGRIERQTPPLQTFRSSPRGATIARGNAWQQGFVDWIDGASVRPVPA